MVRTWESCSQDFQFRYDCFSVVWDKAMGTDDNSYRQACPCLTRLKLNFVGISCSLPTSVLHRTSVKADSVPLRAVRVEIHSAH